MPDCDGCRALYDPSIEEDLEELASLLTSGRAISVSIVLPEEPGEARGLVESLLRRIGHGDALVDMSRWPREIVVRGGVSIAIRRVEEGVYRLETA